MDPFSWKRIAKIVGWIVLVCAVAGGLYLFVVSKPVKIAWASLVHDNREYDVDCEHLPFYPEVEEAGREHTDVVAKVAGIPGVVSFGSEQIHCKIYEGGMEFVKGHMLLVYKTRAARRQAERIIGKDFFGIPYRGEATNN